MDNSLEIYEYLKKCLIDWDEDRWNDENIMYIEMGSLPTSPSFDYIFLSPPIINQQGITTGSRGVQRSTQTYVLDIYTKRIGLGNASKRASRQALIENVNFVSDIFARLGFTISMPQADLNYSGNGTIRQIMNITKTFIK